MAWIQDMNWPVAQELSKVLPRFHRPLVPVFRGIFAGEDEIWKYWTIMLLESFPKETLLLLQPDIERMAVFPTDGEKAEGSCRAAYGLLQRMKDL
jgi:hypothetical protein